MNAILLATALIGALAIEQEVDTEVVTESAIKALDEYHEIQQAMLSIANGLSTSEIQKEKPSLIEVKPSDWIVWPEKKEPTTLSVPEYMQVLRDLGFPQEQFSGSNGGSDDEEGDLPHSLQLRQKLEEGNAAEEKLGEDNWEYNEFFHMDLEDKDKKVSHDGSSINSGDNDDGYAEADRGMMHLEPKLQFREALDESDEVGKPVSDEVDEDIFEPFDIDTETRIIERTPGLKENPAKGHKLHKIRECKTFQNTRLQPAGRRVVVKGRTWEECQKACEDNLVCGTIVFDQKNHYCSGTSQQSRKTYGLKDAQGRRFLASDFLSAHCWSVSEEDLAKEEEHKKNAAKVSPKDSAEAAARSDIEFRRRGLHAPASAIETKTVSSQDKAAIELGFDIDAEYAKSVEKKTQAVGADAEFEASQERQAEEEREQHKEEEEAKEIIDRQARMASSFVQTHPETHPKAASSAAVDYWKTRSQPIQVQSAPTAKFWGSKLQPLKGTHTLELHQKKAAEPKVQNLTKFWEAKLGKNLQLKQKKADPISGLAKHWKSKQQNIQQKPNLQLHQKTKKHCKTFAAHNLVKKGSLLQMGHNYVVGVKPKITGDFLTCLQTCQEDALCQQVVYDKQASECWKHDTAELMPSDAQNTKFIAATCTL